MPKERVNPVCDQMMFFVFPKPDKVSKVRFASKKGSYPERLA